MSAKVQKDSLLRMLPRDVLCLFALLALLLFCFQFITMTKLGDLPPGMTYLTFSGYVGEISARQIRFDWLDGLLAGMIAVISLTLVALEVYRQRVSLFLAGFFSSDLHASALLATFSLVCTRYYFSQGTLSWAGDASQHIAYADFCARSIAEGTLPIWTNYFGTGSPYLQFYGFLFFYLVGIVNLVVRDLFLSLKLLLAITHTASGIGMYFLARTLCRSRRAGFFAGLGYVLCFWHTQHILFMGRLPLSLVYALLPWPFYFFEHLLLHPRRTTLICGGGLCLGLLILTHPGYGVWATVMLTVYMGIRLLDSAGRESLGEVLRASIALVSLGLIFSAYLTLPMWLERDYTGLRAGFSLADVPTPTWQHLLFWSNFRFWLFELPTSAQHWYGGYLGLSLIGMGCFGFARTATPEHRRRFPHLAGGACLAISLLLVFGSHWPVLEALPGIHLLAPYRYLVFVTFFLALMAGWGAKKLLLFFGRKKRRTAICSSLLLLLAVDLGPTTFQHPFKSTPTEYDPTGYPNEFFADFAAEAREYRDRDELPPYRIFWAPGATHPYLALGRLPFTTHTATPTGPHPGELRPNREYIKPLERYLSIAFANLPESDEQILAMDDFGLLAGLLALLDVKYLFATQENDDLRVLTFPDHTPILVSARVSSLSASGVEVGQFKGLERVGEQLTSEMREWMLSLFRLIQATGLNLREKTCERILLPGASRNEDLGTQPRVDLLDYRVWNQRVELRVRVSASCFARLAFAYYPHLQIYVDGNKVESIETADHFIALRLDAGEHRIFLEPSLSPLRRCLLVLDLLLLGMTAWAFVRETRPQQRPK